MLVIEMPVHDNCEKCNWGKECQCVCKGKKSECPEKYHEMCVDEKLLKKK